MTILFTMISLTIVLCIMVCMGVFFHYLKYVYSYGILLWGIFLLSNLLILGLVEASSHFLFPNLSKESCVVFFENVLMIFELAIILMLFAQFVLQPRALLMGIFITFMAMWFIEYALKAEGQSLNTTEFFVQVLIVLLSLFYLLKLHSQSITDYYKIPFFWISIGWLISSLISVILFIPNIASKAAVWSKEIVIIITGIAQIISFILYAIGFQKTKNWVIQNSNPLWKL